MYFLTLFLLATTAHAVSLASFTPRIDQLPTQCNTAYRTTISGCVGDEFSAGATCSAACIQGLEEVGKLVVQACKDVDVGETSIIGLFQIGSGVRALCPNNEDETTTTSSTMSRSTSTQLQTSKQATVTSTGASATPTESSRPPSTSSGLFVDPAVTSTLATSLLLAPTSSSEPASETSKGQLSNSHSGGGSPFDIVAVGASSCSHAFSSTLALLLSAIAFLIVCV